MLLFVKELKMKKKIIYQFCISTLLLGNLLQAQIHFPDLKYTVLNDSIATIGVNVNFKPVFKDTIIASGVLSGMDKEFTFIGSHKDSELECSLFYSNKKEATIPELFITKNDTVLFRGSSNTYHFKGNTLYTEGNPDDLFNRKRKFTLINNNYKEIKQSLYDVGIKGNLKTPLTVYQLKKNETVLANLPENYPIEIIAAYYKDESILIDQLLIKTKFGLIGWVPMKVSYLKGQLINEFQSKNALK